MALLTKTEKKIFRLRRDFYESQLYPREVHLQDNVLSLVIHGKNCKNGGRYLLRIDPVESATWIFPQGTMSELSDSLSVLLITNIWLVYKYIEHTDHELRIDLWPECGLRVKIVQDSPLGIRVRKMKSTTRFPQSGSGESVVTE